MGDAVGDKMRWILAVWPVRWIVWMVSPLGFRCGFAGFAQDLRRGVGEVLVGFLSSFNSLVFVAG